MTFPQIDPVLVHIGPIAVRWYALAYVAGIMLGWRYCVGLVRNGRLWRGAAPTATPAQIDDFMLWVTLGIILGGRVGYILFYMIPQDGPALAKDPLAALRIWEGGMSFHGGLIGVTLAIIGFARANRIDIVRLADLTAPCVPFGLFFVRLANFVNGELWGRPTTLPWGMVFPHAGPEPRHPSQLYEAGLEGLVIFAVLRWATHGRKLLPRQGACTGLFLVLYGVARISLENVREPDRGMPAFPFGLTMGMILSVPLLLGGLGLLWWSRRAQALAPPAPVSAEPLLPTVAPTAHPPEAASDLFPALESEVADPFRPVPSGYSDEPARPA